MIRNITLNREKRKYECNEKDPKGPLFIIPCRCCGRANHSTLQVVECTPMGTNMVKFTCPMARKKTPIIWDSKLKNLILWPTARRFAEHHKYRKEAATRALTSFHKYGSGKWMSTVRARNFRMEVISECEDFNRIGDKGKGINIDHHSCTN
jgi:hypothetical protein